MGFKNILKKVTKIIIQLMIAGMVSLLFYAFYISSEKSIKNKEKEKIMIEECTLKNGTPLTVSTNDYEAKVICIKNESIIKMGANSENK